MKKLISFSLLLWVVGILYASPSFGYNFAPMGESFGGDSFAAVEATATLSFTGDKHIGDLAVEALVGLGEPNFKGANLILSTPLVVTRNHLFNSCFVNPVYWEPKLSIGWQYRQKDKANRLMVGLSPLNFADRGYTYEFLSPYLVMDEKRNLGWGFKIMKFTVYLGG